MLQQDKCANCTRAIDGAEQKFCPACGQPTPAHRIDWHFLGHELEHSVLHMDRGVFYSLKELMLRPGHLMRDYLEGRRAKQVKPLLLLMISAAATLLLAKLFLEGDIVGSAIQVGSSQGEGMRANGDVNPAELARIFGQLKDWLNAHMTAFTLVLLPFEAATFWLVFRGRGLNYPEWLVISAFLTVQAFVFMAVSILLRHWFPSVQMWTLALVSAYIIFSLVQLFRDHSRWTTALRGIVGLGLYFVVQGIVTALLLVIVLFVSGWR